MKFRELVAQTVDSLAALFDVDKDWLLKTDLFNETLPTKIFDIKKPIGNWVYVEKDFDRCKLYKKLNGKNVICGDIRFLPFKDKIFEIVLDVSTSDHVIDVGQVFDEYDRVLKEGGKQVSVFVYNKKAYVIHHICGCRVLDHPQPK